MNKERLLKLAEVLEAESRGYVLKVPGDGKVAFDLAGYIWPDSDRPHNCDTAACALGYAGLHPWFQRRGVYSNVKTGDVTFKGIELPGVDGSAQFFDIEEEDAGNLFYASRYPEYNRNPTPKQVAKRIRKFVAEHSR